MPRVRCKVLVSLLLLVIAGCAGYRGGWLSVAYIGDAPPALDTEASTAPTRERPTLRVPGLELQVGLDNQLRTYDTQIYLFALPLSVDPRKVYPKNNEPNKTRAFVTVTPAEPGFVFRPREARLGIADKRIAGVGGYEFGMWDREGKPVHEHGTWDHRPVDQELLLGEAARRYYLSIDFATPVPSPESREITLDLSRALISPRYPSIPLIRFAPMRWREGYT